MNRLVVLNRTLKQVKAEPFNYRDGKCLAEYLEDGWTVANQLTRDEQLVILLERADHRASQNGAAGTAKFSGP